MLKRFKIGNVILSEYGVKGENNKHTLVNIFAGDITIESLPAQLNLCVYIELMEIKEQIEFSVSIRVDNKEYANVRATIAPEGEGPKNALIFLPSFQIAISKSIVLSMVCNAEGYSPKILMSKKISEGLMPTSPIV